MVRINRRASFGFAVAVCIVLGFAARLTGQQESSESEIAPDLRSPTAERYRQRHLSANQKAVDSFYQRNLPPGFVFTYHASNLKITRVAPTYVLQLPPEETHGLAKTALLKLARTRGKKTNCEIQFRVERHDDAALVRQKLKLYKGVLHDIEAAYTRLNLKHLCRGVSLADCSMVKGTAGEAAQEFLATRKILGEKIEVTPLYRIGTLYLYPLRNQCIPDSYDWYVTNETVPLGALLLPLEAAEEVQIILRNMEQLKLWR